MDFSKKVLEKYGWKEGEGLGRNSDGITKPLRPKLKFDKTGLGSNEAIGDFNNHWWERAFNEASSNLSVKRKNGEIKMKVKDEKSLKISTNQKLNNENQINRNGRIFFLKNFLSTSATENENANETDANAMLDFKKLTDEELFLACGGRTAHKGARHGLYLHGKLSRLEKQDEEFLIKMKNGTKLNEMLHSKTNKPKKKRKENT